MATFSSDRCNGGVAIASSYRTEAGSSYPIENAFDDNTSSIWISNEIDSGVANVAWIGYQFATPKKIKQLRYIYKNVFFIFLYVNNNVSSFVLQASNNGSSWVSIQPFTNQPIGTANANTWITLDVTNEYTVSYTHWRLLATANVSISGTESGCGWGISELEMKEENSSYCYIIES